MREIAVTVTVAVKHNGSLTDDAAIADALVEAAKRLNLTGRDLPGWVTVSGVSGAVARPANVGRQSRPTARPRQ